MSASLIFFIVVSPTGVDEELIPLVYYDVQKERGALVLEDYV